MTYFKNRKNGVVGKSEDFDKIAKKFPGVFAKITKEQFEKGKAERGKKKNKGHDKVVTAPEPQVDAETAKIIEAAKKK